MFYFEDDNAKIGSYLNSLIKRSYPNVRRFCIAYLNLAKIEETGEAITKMHNRMSQIIQGKKSIQTYDLPRFCELLGVSCEEILSAGKHFEPTSGHVTNYEIAFSHDKKIWDKYMQRDDKLFLNSDEYNKTVIDYALEFKNYAFMKYLMDNKYIWFVDETKDHCFDYEFGFGAGTSIKRREIDTLGINLQYNCEKKGLRQKMIALAIENNDFKMLTNLRAREVPTLYQLCITHYPQTTCKDYYDESVIDEILKSSDKVLDFFSEEFEIIDQFGNKHSFMYPYLPKVLDRMIKDKNKYTEVLLRRSIEHNKQVLDKLQSMVNETFEILQNTFNYSEPVIETLVKETMNYFIFNSDDSFIAYSVFREKDKSSKFCTNIIKVTEKSNDLLIDNLITELNNYYNAVCNVKPDTSNY